MIKYILLLIVAVCCFSCKSEIETCKESVFLLNSYSANAFADCKDNQKAQVEEKTKPNGDIFVIVKCVCTALGEKQK